ncbi:MAG: TetR/AcrR family transcriptional regulator [Actinomycetota bacterium]|nr:TetR/AcrR family transcriptional regulator [Actinomycetota bacterium]
MSTPDLPPRPRMPTRPSPARRATRPRTLSREVIVDAALKIIDAEGLDALTMRTVAHTLGTGQASLYAHVAHKEDLLELVIERVIGECDFDIRPDPERWQEQVKQAMREMRAVFGRHGDLARASFARIPLGENALRGSETMIGVLRAGGLPDRVIAFACDLLPLYAMAIAYEESLYSFEGATEADFDAFVGSMRSYFQNLPGDRFPHLVALAGLLTEGDNNERFEFGLEVLVRGLAAMAR